MKTHLRRAQFRALRAPPSRSTFHRFPPEIGGKYSNPTFLAYLSQPTTNSSIDELHPTVHRKQRPSSVADQDKERHRFNRRQKFKMAKGKNANKQSSSDANFEGSHPSV